MAVRILPQYVSVPEAARRLGCAKRTVYGYIERDLLRADRVGRALLVPVDALKSFEKPKAGNPRFRDDDNARRS